MKLLTMFQTSTFVQLNLAMDKLFRYQQIIEHVITYSAINLIHVSKKGSSSKIMLNELSFLWKIE